MKEAGKPKKQRSTEYTRAAKPSCGTMAYMAASRGQMQRGSSSWWPKPPDINRIVRRNPADK